MHRSGKVDSPLLWYIDPVNTEHTVTPSQCVDPRIFQSS